MGGRYEPPRGLCDCVGWSSSIDAAKFFLLDSKDMEPRLKLEPRRIGKNTKWFTRRVRATLTNPRLRQALLVTEEIGGEGCTYVLNGELSIRETMGLLDWAKYDIWEDYMKRRRARGEE